MSEQTEIQISICANDIGVAKTIASVVFDRIMEAKTFEEVGGFGGGGPNRHYSVWLEYPIQDRIKNYRDLADALEAKLAAGAQQEPAISGVLDNPEDEKP